MYQIKRSFVNTSICKYDDKVTNSLLIQFLHVYISCFLPCQTHFYDDIEISLCKKATYVKFLNKNK